MIENICRKFFDMKEKVFALLIEAVSTLYIYFHGSNRVKIIANNDKSFFVLFCSNKFKNKSNRINNLKKEKKRNMS